MCGLCGFGISFFFFFLSLPKYFLLFVSCLCFLSFLFFYDFLVSFSPSVKVEKVLSGFGFLYEVGGFFFFPFSLPPPPFSFFSACLRWVFVGVGFFAPAAFFFLFSFSIFSFLHWLESFDRMEGWYS